VVLPATTGLYVEDHGSSEAGWDLSLRNIAKGYPYLTGSLRAL
jgi:hypothetical protein